MHKRVLIAVSAMVPLLAVISPVVAQPAKKRLAQVIVPPPPAVPVHAVSATRRTVPVRVDSARIHRLVQSSYPVNHMQRGMLLTQKGNTDAALIEFLKAAQEDPTQVRAYYQQAVIFKQKGYSKLAQSALQQALAVKPTYHDARVLLASIYLDEGNVSGAAQELFRSLGLPGAQASSADHHDAASDRALAHLQSAAVRLPAIVQTPHGKLANLSAPRMVLRHNDAFKVEMSTPATPVPAAAVPAIVAATGQPPSLAKEPQTADDEDELLKQITGVDPKLALTNPAAAAAGSDGFTAPAGTANPPPPARTAGSAPATAAPPPLPPPAMPRPGAGDGNGNGSSPGSIHASGAEAERLLKQVKKQKEGSSGAGFNFLNPFSWFRKDEVKPAAPPVAAVASAEQGALAEKIKRDVERKAAAQQSKRIRKTKTRVASWFDNFLDGSHVPEAPAPQRTIVLEDQGDRDFNPLVALARTPQPVPVQRSEQPLPQPSAPVPTPINRRAGYPQPKDLAPTPFGTPSPQGPVGIISDGHQPNLIPQPSFGRYLPKYLPMPMRVPSKAERVARTAGGASKWSGRSATDNQDFGLGILLRNLPGQIVAGLQRAMALPPHPVSHIAPEPPPLQPVSIRTPVVSAPPSPSVVPEAEKPSYQNLVTARVDSKNVSNAAPAIPVMEEPLPPPEQQSPLAALLAQIPKLAPLPAPWSPPPALPSLPRASSIATRRDYPAPSPQAPASVSSAVSAAQAVPSSLSTAGAPLPGAVRAVASAALPPAMPGVMVPSFHASEPAPVPVARSHAAVTPAPAPIGADVRMTVYPATSGSMASDEVQPLMARAELSEAARRGLHAPNLTLDQQRFLETMQPAVKKKLPPAAPAPHEAIYDNDAFSQRMKFLVAHGTSSLRPHEAFMFDEETGEGLLFLADGSSVRRKIAAPRGHEEVARLRRPDILNAQGELQYSLSLLGKIIKPQASPAIPPPTARTAMHTPAARMAPLPGAAAAKPASGNNLSVPDFLNRSSEGFFDWLKGIVHM